MDTLPDVLARNRDREGVAFTAPERLTPTSHREFATSAWKAGNLLRHYGVRPGSRVAVVIGPKEPPVGVDPGTLGSTADPLVGLLGAAVAGATVEVTPDRPVEARALLVPDPWLDQYDAAPGCSVLAYGGPPDSAEVAHFERERWSENPTEPPGTVGTGDPVLRVDGTDRSHGELLDAARRVIEEYGLEANDTVLVDATLRTAGSIVAGVIAPLVAGATIQPGGAEAGDSRRGAVYVVRTDTAVDAGDTRGDDAVDARSGEAVPVLHPSTVIG